MHVPPSAIIPPVVPVKWEGTHPAGRDSRRSAGAASPPRWAEWWRPRTARRLWRWTGSSGSTCIAGGSRPHRPGCRRGRGSSRGLGAGAQHGSATGLRHKAWSPHVQACVLSRIPLFVTPWTTARQAPLSMGFSRQESWRGLPCPPPGNLPHPGIEPASPVPPALQADSLPLSQQGSLGVSA